MIFRCNQPVNYWGQVDNFAVDSAPFRDYEAGEMLDDGARAFEIRILSGIAGHLASALDALAISGCERFAADILEMLAAIDGQIALLEEPSDGGAALSF